MAETTTTVVYDGYLSPKITLTRVRTTGSAFEQFTVVAELSGLAPDRTTTAEERAEGVLSLEPPTAEADDPRVLIDRIVRAVTSSWAATSGVPSPALYGMARYLVARAVRAALRQLGELDDPVTDYI